MLKVGIVGYGYATRVFHAPLIAAVPGLELAAIASSRPDQAALDWPGVALEPSPAALFARPELDLVVLPTPNPSHYPLALQALEAGKHVLVDKPFTITLAEARSLRAHAQQAGRVLSVFQNRRWDSDFLTLEALLATGELGEVMTLESRFERYVPGVRDRWRERAGAGSGLWYDLGPHLLDQALCLFGAPEAIELDLARQRHGAQTDDYFSARLSYGATRVLLHASTLAPRPGPRFTVHGRLGSFIKPGLDPQEKALLAGLRPPAPDWGADAEPGTLSGFRDGAPFSRSVPSLPGDYPAFYAALRDAIQSVRTNPVTPDEAVRVMALIELGRRSAEERRELAVAPGDLA